MSVRHTCGRCEADLPAEAIVAHAVFCHRCGTMWPAPSRARGTDLRRLTGRLSMGAAAVLFVAGLVVFGVVRKNRYDDALRRHSPNDGVPPSITEAPSTVPAPPPPASSNRPYLMIPAHDGSVVDVAFLRLGSDIRLATAGEDRRVRVWAPQGGGRLGSDWKSPTGITAMAAAGAAVAVGDKEGNVRVLRVPISGDREPLTFRGPGVSISALAFSSEGRFLAAAAGTSVRLWTADDPNHVLCDFAEHKDFIHALAFSPDSRFLASASEDRTVLQFHTGAGGVSWNTLVGHREAVTAVAFASADPRTALTASRDRTLRVWNSDTGHERERLSVGQAVSVCAISPDARLIAAASGNAFVRVWRRGGGTAPANGVGVTSLRSAIVLGPLDGTVRSLAFSPDGRTLAAGDTRGIVTLWQVERLADGAAPTH